MEFVIILKSVFTGIAAIILCILFVCCFFAFLKNTKLTRSIAYLMMAAFFTIIFFGAADLTINEHLAKILFSLYGCMLQFSVLALMRCVYILEHLPKIQNWKRVSLYVFIVLAVIDALALVFVPDFYYTIKPVYYKNGFYCWDFSVNTLFIFHLILTYCLSINIVISLIKDFIKAASFYKSKYITVLCLFAVAIALNCCFYIFASFWKFDFSICVFGLVSIILFYYICNWFPKSARMNMLSIANENISDAVICFDFRENCIYKNQYGRKIYDNHSRIWLKKYFTSDQDFLIGEELLEIDGSSHIFKVEFRKMYDKRGRYSGCYVLLKDRTLEIKNMEREEYRASHDELTGVYSRLFFFTEVERVLKTEPDVPRYLVATNIKNFKLVNDLFGVKVGDNLLKHQAEMLSLAKYRDCIVGRISGDKFAMLIAKKDFNPELAIKNSKRITEIVEHMSFSLEVQLGIYEIANVYENPHTMYDKAALAIKNLKNDKSGTRLAIYDTSLMKKMMIEKNIISEFKYALESGQFLLYLQPQIESKNEKCVGGEALVRWCDPVKGFLQPGQFIPILEKSGLIYQLDHYIWEKSAQVLSEWQKKGFEDYYISINISVKDFYYADLYEVFTGLVEKYNIPPHLLNIELTESIIMDNHQYHKTILRRLQEYGFNIEMDDFGSGYSSLSLLKDINMDVLKIDMAFLQKTENEERGKSIIGSVVSMAKELGMEVVTEGVETVEQKDFLKDLGVDLYQGYYFSKPIPLEDFEHKYLEAEK